MQSHLHSKANKNPIGQPLPKSRDKQNTPLPKYWRYRRGVYWYRVPENVRHLWDNKTEFMLGKSLSEAYATWADRMEYIDTPRTMNELFDRYLVEIVPTKALRTQESNEASIRKLRPAFGLMSPEAIKPKHAYQYNDITAKKRGKTTAKRDVEVLRHVLTIATSWGVLDANPLLGQVRITGNPARDRYVESWEVAELLKVTGHQMRSINLAKCFIRLKLMTGLRRGDLLALKLSDLKEDGIHCKPAKTGKTTGKRIIYQWSDKLRGVIDEIRSIPPRRIGNAHLFTTRQGKPYGKNAFDSLWARFMDRALKQTKITDRFHEHDLRAKVASDSSSLLEAAERLGHADPSTTNRIYRRKPTFVKPLE